MPTNFTDAPITLFIRALRATRALRGVEVLVGTKQLPAQTAPNRLVIWPFDANWDEPGDLSVSLVDVEQQVVAELWGKGSSSSANPNEAVLADINACWGLLVAFVQALAEQGENRQQPDVPGAFWEVVGPIGWDTGKDTNQQGTSVKVICQIRCAVPAASDDQGHVGDNWQQGTVKGVSISTTITP
jgi:hypothetical protein